MKANREGFWFFNRRNKNALKIIQYIVFWLLTNNNMCVIVKAFHTKRETWHKRLKGKVVKL